jgi:hypothetical protein
MSTYSGKSKLLSSLETIENFHDEIEWDRIEESDEGLYENLKEEYWEACQLLDKLEILYVEKQPIYNVCQVSANERCDMIIRLDALVEKYPFLTEALVIHELNEISFVDNNSVSVQIKKVQ